MILGRTALAVLFVIYTIAGWVVGGVGVAEFHDYRDGVDPFRAGMSHVEGLFPTIGLFFHMQAFDFALWMNSWPVWPGGWLPAMDEKFMNKVVMAQVVLMPAIMAFVLVCVTAVVMRRYKGVR